MVRPEKASPTLLGGDGEEIIVIPGPADLACERRQTIDRLCRGNSNREFDPSSGTRGEGVLCGALSIYWRARE